MIGDKDTNLKYDSIEPDSSAPAYGDVENQSMEIIKIKGTRIGAVWLANGPNPTVAIKLVSHYVEQVTIESNSMITFLARI